MSEVIHAITSIAPPFNMIVLIVLICSISGIITSVAKQVRKYACHRQDVELKQDMLDRGMSAEEIEQVIRAGGTDRES